ncbi:MAG: cytochrome P450 [Halioglobus sp.]|jgi:cytochrome P450
MDFSSYNFSPINPDFLHDPYPAYEHLRSKDPLHWSDLGFWVVSRFDDCRSTLIGKDFGQGDFVKNIQLFYGEDFDVLSHHSYAWLSRVFVMQDPPAHTRVRGLVAGALSLKRIRAMEPRIRELAVKLLDEYDKGDSDNFIADFAYQFPTKVMCDMLGMRDDEYPPELLLKLNQAIADSFIVFETRALSDAELAHADKQMQFLTDVFDELFASRRANPQNDLTTALVQSQEAGESLTPEELSTSVIGLFGAGFETTAHMIGNGMYCLGKHPEQRQRLVEDPILAAHTTEEVLRFESSLQASYRTALVRQELGGQVIEQGQRVLVLVAAANRDEDHFSNPDQFDISEREQKPLTFGGGIHYCIGAELARIEGKVFFEELVKRYPNFSVDSASARLRPAFMFRGFEYLDVNLQGR